MPSSNKVRKVTSENYPTDDLAGKTNRSRNELIGLALDYAKDKIIVEE